MAAILLYGPDGNAVRRRTLPLTSRVIRVLCDGRYFAEAYPHVLRSARLEPYCLRCHAAGLPASITPTLHDDRLDVACAHRSGYIRRNRHADTSEILHALGWNIRCLDCQQTAQADNSQADPTFRVSCPCTIREMPNPRYAGQTDAPTRLYSA